MNIKFTVQYKGSHYYGWQIQKKEATIQGELKKAFKIILPNETINIIGSGRTDSGVHAYGQVVSLKLSHSSSDLDKLFKSVNGIINNDIYILNYEHVTDDFNARYSAKHRTYKYYINTQYSPFNSDTSWFVNNKIDLIQLNQCAKALIGEHNFSMLSKKNTETTNKICTIYESYWEDYKNELIYTIKSNRFLHHMVRFIVGTSVEVAKSKIMIADFINLINNNSEISPMCAPAKGLFLFEVGYD
tara:strand:- start:584 stop:1315 length:732 start_codon:yes stop_codon:yes gene_type:complete